jgi:aminoglycoside phosphotransferase
MAKRASSKKKPPASVKPDDSFQATDLTPEALAFLHVFALGCGKIGYKHADAAVDLLLKKQKRGTVTIGPIEPHINPLLQEFAKFASTLAGKKFRIADNWRGRTKVNTGSNVRRYELEEVTSL